MTIIVDAENDDDITITSLNLKGNVCYHENQIAFLKNVIKHLEEESSKQKNYKSSYL